MVEHNDARRTDIDSLRILATFLLFPFHVAMVFSPAPFYHVRNDDLSLLALVFTGFVSLWHMPMFFFLAGWSAIASLRGRGANTFARKRVTRLLVPLVVACVLFAPAIKWIELRGGQDLNHRGLFVAPELAPSFDSVLPQRLPPMTPFDETFGEFLPTFFTDLDRFTWSHLWFVAYLFTLSLVWLPLLARLADQRDQHATEGDSRFAPARHGRAIVYLPIVPLAAIQVVLRPYWPGVQNLYDDWANVAYYSTYLLLGALLCARPTYERIVDREWRRALAVSTVALIALLTAVLGVLKSEPIVLALTAVAGWSFVIFLLGASRQLSLRPSAALAYLSEASMPIYVLHQPAIVILAWVVVGWPLGPLAKFTLILAGSVAMALLVYHLFVRRMRSLRLAFGMKPLAGKLQPVASVGTAASAFVLVLGATTAVASTTPTSPIGTWWAEGGAAQVQLEPCGTALCGRVVWLRSPFDENGCALVDRYNADPALRARDVLGMEIVHGLVAQEPTPRSEWSGGTIYDPTSGRTYDCALRVRDADRLEIRGYFGLRVLGRTVVWTRVGSEERACRE